MSERPTGHEPWCPSKSGWPCECGWRWRQQIHDLTEERDRLATERAEVLRIASTVSREYYISGSGQDAGQHWETALDDIVEKLTGKRPPDWTP